MERKIQLSGTWEREGKNPLLASFILVFILGGLYAFISSLIANIYVAIDVAMGGFRFEDDNFNFIELYKAFYQRYKYIILVLNTDFSSSFRSSLLKNGTPYILVHMYRATTSICPLSFSHSWVQYSLFL
jgi:hypothetical protein